MTMAALLYLVAMDASFPYFERQSMHVNHRLELTAKCAISN
jgi:hypothetical protein